MPKTPKLPIRSRKGKFYTYLNYQDINGKWKCLEKQLPDNYTLDDVAKTQQFLQLTLEALTNVESHGFIEPIENLTFGQVVEKWLEHKVLEISEMTLYIYQNNVKCHLLPTLENQIFTSLQPNQIQAIVNNLHKQKQFASIQAVKKHLSSIYRFAINQDLVSKSILQKVTFPKMPFVESLAMTADEAKRFLESAKLEKHPRWQLMFELFLLTGCRPSEIYGLKWKYVDFAKKTIYITEIANPKRGAKEIFKEPKTTRSRRFIPITESMCEKLRTWKEATKDKLNLYQVVFPNRNGYPCQHSEVFMIFKRIAQRAKINPKFSPYTFRHTTATLMLQNGENIKVIASRLGDDVSMMLRRYAHVWESSQVEATENLERLWSAS